MFFFFFLRGVVCLFNRMFFVGSFVCSTPRAPNTKTKKVLWGVFRGLSTFLEGIWSPREQYVCYFSCFW